MDGERFLVTRAASDIGAVAPGPVSGATADVIIYFGRQEAPSSRSLVRLLKAQIGVVHCEQSGIDAKGAIDTRVRSTELARP
jgi:hypothetical protein